MVIYAVADRIESIRSIEWALQGKPIISEELNGANDNWVAFSR